MTSHCNTPFCSPACAAAASRARMRAMRFSLVLAASLLAAACGSKSPSSTTTPTGGGGGGSGEVAAKPLPDVPFDNLDHDQRIQFMKEKVVPTMEPLFKAHDATKFADFGCK